MLYCCFALLSNGKRITLTAGRGVLSSKYHSIQSALRRSYLISRYVSACKIHLNDVRTNICH